MEANLKEPSSVSVSVGVDLGFQDALLVWFEQYRRRLPWRETRDPWAILVSETMLQQTQVDRVIPKFNAFMAAYPDVRSCADVDIVRALRGGVVASSDLVAITGWQDPGRIERVVQRLVDEGLVVRDGDTLRLSSD